MPVVEAELLDRLAELEQRAVERGHACGHAESSLVVLAGRR
jgi:hypothetical protein